MSFYILNLFILNILVTDYLLITFYFEILNRTV